MLKVRLFIDGDWLDQSAPVLSEASSGHALHSISEVGHYFVKYFLETMPRLGDRYTLRSEVICCNPISLDPEQSNLIDIIAEDTGAVIFQTNLGQVDVDDDDLDAVEAEYAYQTAGVAVSMTERVMSAVYGGQCPDIVLIASGHEGYLPLVESLRARGVLTGFLSIRETASATLIDQRINDMLDWPLAWIEEHITNMRRGRARSQEDRPRTRGPVTRRFDTNRLQKNRPAKPVAPVRRPAQEVPSANQPRVSGYIKNILWDRGYGFVAGSDGEDYFFHANALQGGLEFTELQPEMDVSVVVKNPPGHGRAGAASAVFPADGHPVARSPEMQIDEAAGRKRFGEAQGLPSFLMGDQPQPSILDLESTDDNVHED